MSDRLSVLFVNRVFPPAEGATGEILKELCEQLAGFGVSVTVLSIRTHPDQPLAETIGSIQVRRCATAVRFTRNNQLVRALSYLSAYFALMTQLVRLRRQDVIVFMTDPPMLASMGLLTRVVSNARLVHWAQDVYPEIAEELGVLKRGGVLARALKTVSTLALRRFDRIVAIGECMRDRLVSRGLAATRLTVIPNWADTTNIQRIEPRESQFRKELDLVDKRVVMYSGNMGLGHSFETILAAMKHFAATDPDVTFLFVATGGQVAPIQDRIRKYGLKNVLFRPLQPRSKLADTLGAGDIHLASMANSMAGLMVPSKIYGILAAGRPCILVGPPHSEAARLIEANRCGTVVGQDDADGLVEALSNWLASSANRTEAGLRGRQAAEKSNLGAAAKDFELLFNNLTRH